MVAGEASGDLLAALLLEALNQRIEGLAAYGIGGPRMASQGFRALWPMDRLAVRGYVEVLRHYPEIAMIRRRLRQTLLASPPRAFIGVDAPDFNLGLEAALRSHGIPTIHFVSPSIWAWRRERIETMRRAVDHVLVVFPFEEAIYRDAGIPVSYVGHPLADVIPESPDRAGARLRLGLPADEPVLALLPGSRLSEIHYLGAVFVRAAAQLQRETPRLHLIVPMVSRAARTRFEAIVGRLDLAGLRLQVFDGASHDALAACDAALVASGTATLEAALFKRPMVIAYRMAYLTWIKMRRMGYLPWVGLPNILAREFLVPELLQDAVTEHALVDAVRFQLFDTGNRAQLEACFLEMHRSLRRDTARAAADVVARLVGDRDRDGAR